MNIFSAKQKPLQGVPVEVQRIYNLLSPKPKELLQNAENRKFVREGEVGIYNQKEKRTKRRFLFLFNDMLLVTKRESKSSFWLKVYISLRSSLQIQDVPDSTTKHKVEFRIYAPKATIILFAHSEDEKLVWLRDLQGCTSGDYTKKGNDLAQGSSALDFSEEPTSSSQPLENEQSFGSIPENDSSDEETPKHKSVMLAAANDGYPAATPPSTPVEPSMLDNFENRSRQFNSYAIGAGAPVPFANSQPLPFIPANSPVSILTPVSIIPNNSTIYATPY